MTSGGRELLKWLAVAMMTGDHILSVFQLGYVPVVSELGRVAFPIFALVMGYNLAQPGARVGTSVTRLALWAVLAQPIYAWVFGLWFPINVLGTFALAACAVWALERAQWPLLVGLLVLAPIAVDYAWPGVWLVVGAYAWFEGQPVTMGGRLRAWLLLGVPMALLCAYNGNGWALLALPALLLGMFQWRVPRTRWAFYGYYVGHLAVLGLVASAAS
jgi:hypothetical protein